jgi:molybdopterin-biosynthesis enzyme MoeA-like protein
VRTIQVVDRVDTEVAATMKWAIDQQPTFVLVTGGLGPNWDDSTRACLARAAGLELEENPQAIEHVQNAYRRLFAKKVVSHPDLNDARRVMAMLPKGAVCYENLVGSAPAVQLRVGPTTVFLLPGVPAEMQQLFTGHVMPVMSSEGPDTVRGERTVEYHGHDESSISRVLKDISARHPDMSIRTRVQGTDLARTIRIVLVAEHEDAVQLNEMLETAEQNLRDRLGVELATPPTDASRLGD